MATETMFTAVFVVSITLFFWWGWRSWFWYYRDPLQHELANLLGRAAVDEIESANAIDTSTDIAFFVRSKSWPKKQHTMRLMHAAELLEAEQDDIRSRAEDIAKRAIVKLKTRT